jgi:retinol-binding protein 3
MRVARIFKIGFAALVVLGCISASIASPHADAEPNAFSLQARKQLVTALNEYYVFPDVARDVGTTLKSDFRKGAFDQYKSGPDLAAALTQRLRDVTREKHLGVSFSATPILPEPASELTPAQLAERQRVRLERMQKRNFSIARVECLKQNVGCISIVGFEPAEEAGPAIAAAMRLVAHSDALIIDLRENDGEYPSGVAQLESYLFDSRTHLNDMYIREGNRVEETWTLDELAGPRYGEKRPVFLLTSRKTFSGGEDMAYTMQQLRRAAIVGEATGGGANPGRDFRLNAHFSAFIPFARAVNPITKGNWEGKGVQPDIKTSADGALSAAHSLALKSILAWETNTSRVNDIQALIAELGSATRVWRASSERQQITINAIIA